VAITLAPESPLQAEVRDLIADLDAYLSTLAPAEANHFLSVDQLAEPGTTLWVARDNGKAVACGALKRHTDRIGEVKRMYTRPEWQGQGIGRRVLGEIVSVAMLDGLEELVLETGDGLAAAWAIYEKAGFVRCGPVLDYPDSEYSVFYHKQLSA
jgi:putative acetyltransferase